MKILVCDDIDLMVKALAALEARNVKVVSNCKDAFAKAAKAANELSVAFESVKDIVKTDHSYFERKRDYPTLREGLRNPRIRRMKK